ncbi:hypothetical protein [uncultured Chryseobacterium sp.]|uniref:hypothetical protein n=1 Tax=uncultured Chryseobacterium sp. TaxID=259322 RepID=UPI0025E09533|nr:hypothetical protein [uncultured Chryseobacterium sp.]
MKDILEFRAFTRESSFLFSDKNADDFIFFIESKSLYWGGGYGKEMMQGGLYGEGDLNIDKQALSDDLTVFFRDINENIILEINFF